MILSNTIKLETGKGGGRVFFKSKATGFDFWNRESIAEWEAKAEKKPVFLLDY
jgi:hypothetical protein